MKKDFGGLIVQLDAKASRLLRRYLSGQRHPTLRGSRDPRDVASAAIVFLLAETDRTTLAELAPAAKRRERAENGWH